MIHINNVSFHYKKGKPILKDISTKLESGHIYGLLGLNGEGKTTLLKLISGLIFPKYGQISLNDLDTKNRSLAFFDQIYMLQDTPKTVSLTINEFEKVYSVFYKKFSREFFHSALEDFSIEIKNKINSLSFGQQKKFHLAFALATNTKYLILDEPTNGLDIPSKSIFRKLLAKSITDDKTFIISTHLVKDIENIIDHLLIINNGNLLFDQNLYETLKAYKFVQSNHKIEEAIYSEQAISNYKSIVQNSDDSESNIDIELLFNAVQKQKL